jgi:hypothetical protein
VDASLVAGFDEELDVCVHEGDSHGDVAAIWKNEFFVIAELLDETENIVLNINNVDLYESYPSTTVQSRGMISQFIDKLVHLESSGNSLDKTGAPDSAPRHPNGILSHTEDIIP